MNKENKFVDEIKRNEVRPFPKKERVQVSANKMESGALSLRQREY